MHRISLSLAVVAASTAIASMASAAEYWVQPTPSGGYDLYDLSSLSRTATGFSIKSVLVDDRLPRVFGPTAYRQSREAYDCGSATYGIVDMREYKADGALLDHVASPGERAMRVVRGSTSAHLYRAACQWARSSGPMNLPGPRVEQPSVRAAYAYGEALLHP